MQAIVTIKLPKNPHHNPQQKKIGKCPANGKLCNDITGEHHSFLMEGENIGDIIKEVKKKFSHVTRVEEV